MAPRDLRQNPFPAMEMGHAPQKGKGFHWLCESRANKGVGGRPEEEEEEEEEAEEEENMVNIC